MSTPQTPADVLDAAADYIDEHGWTQNVYEDEEGACCAMGGILRVSDPDSAYFAEDALQRHLGRTIVQWNDTADQTAANVTHTMREVAASLRGDA